MAEITLLSIAERLEGFEETIVFKLIDRAQYKTNPPVYKQGKSGFKNAGDASLFELRLHNQELMDARFGRFCAPEERAFTGRLPKPHRGVTIGDTGLRCKNLKAINFTAEILAAYKDLLPRICVHGIDKGNFGSSVENDVYALQAISRRVHYGALYVAECKFRDNPEKYRGLIKAKNVDEMLALLTRKEVEDAIIARVREKVAYAQARVNRRVRTVLDPDCIVRFYREHVIPLTKKGEIAYLLNRNL
jgi:chorismate mutase